MTKILVVIGLILLLLTSNVNAAGIGLGVVPSEIEIHNAMKNSEYEKIISVFNTADDDRGFLIIADGECSDWMHFYHIDDKSNSISNITISDNDNAKILVKIKIPENAQNGEYTSKIIIQNIPIEGTVGNTMVVRLPVNVLIEVTGTQILTGIVKSITSSDTEVDYPLAIKVEFKNTGNVAAKPLINVDIYKDETIIDSILYSELEVKPNRKEIIPVEWDTNKIQNGEYIAKVSVLLGEELLTTEDLPIKILPYGTLTRQGNLTGILCENEPTLGMNKLLATFVNTGKIEAKSKFVGEVYKDGILIDSIESNEILTQVKEKVNLTSYLTIDSPGSYTIKGHVEYEGRTTGIEEFVFDVEGTETTPGFSILSAITAFLIIAFTFRKRSR